MLGKRNFAALIAWLVTIMFVLLSSHAMAQGERVGGLISPWEAHELLTGEHPPLLVDVRTKAEFEAGHPNNALNVPLDEFTSGTFAERMGEPSKDDAIIVFCRSGRRSGIVHGILVKNGYSNVRNVKGGIIAWKEAELPLVKEIEGSAEQAGTSVSAD